MADLTTKTARNRLKKRREPYWTRIHKFCHLGFRRGAETWIARYTNRATNGGYSYEYKSLDAVTSVTPTLQYDSAKSAAETWFARMGSPAARIVIRGSVRDALETYLKHLREQGRSDTARNAELNHFKVTVWNDPIADLDLEDLTRHDFREWRERLRDGRKNRSVNRHVRAVVAGLNVAFREGHTGNPDTWSIAPLADDVETGGEAIVFIDVDKRDAIVGAASPACANFLRAIEYTGGRPGELAAATVEDLDKVGMTLTLRHKKGRPAKLRPRAVVLTDESLKFFTQMARGKTPAAPLLRDPAGAAWNRHRWADEIQTAIGTVNARAKGRKRIPTGVSAYTFRHARISELLQVYGIDPLTVAQQTGTSVRMIEEHYHRFIAPALRERLAAVRTA